MGLGLGCAQDRGEVALGSKLQLPTRGAEWQCWRGKAELSHIWFVSLHNQEPQFPRAQGFSPAWVVPEFGTVPFPWLGAPTAPLERGRAGAEGR